jgi:hypothetical protein
MAKDTKTLERAFAEIARSAGTSVSGKSALAELLVEVVEPNHLSLDIFNAFLPTSARNEGDYFTRRMRKNKFRARSHVNGTIPLADTPIMNNLWMHVYDQIIVGLSISQQELERGELGTLENLRAQMRMDLFDEIVSRIFNLMTSVWSASTTPSNYTNATSTGLTATVLDNAMENVIERAGMVKAIAGTRRSLLPLYGFASYREFLLSDNTTRTAPYMEQILLERYQTGKVASYNGAPVIEIPQVLEERLPTITRKLVRDDIVVVIGDDVGEAALLGPTVTQDYTDLRVVPPMYFDYMYQKFGIVIDRPERIHVIETA